MKYGKSEVVQRELVELPVTANFAPPPAQETCCAAGSRDNNLAIGVPSTRQRERQ